MFPGDAIDTDAMVTTIIKVAFAFSNLSCLDDCVQCNDNFGSVC